LLNKNVSTVILGASNLEQLNDNLRAADAIPLLTEELKQRLDDL
jgi:aryl-alcohol dehydrogenase-like predicted oxidoreductase